jgi:hypothetical protein
MWTGARFAACRIAMKCFGENAAAWMTVIAAAFSST